MKKTVILLWIVGSLLAISHLLFLGGADHPPGFWVFSASLLLCYSLPFLLLTRIRIPQAPWPERLITQILFVVVLTISFLLPSSRFLPGYHPDALEGLEYLFVPAFECGLIAIFLAIRHMTRQPGRKKQATIQKSPQ